MEYFPSRLFQILKLEFRQKPTSYDNLHIHVVLHLTCKWSLSTSLFFIYINFQVLERSLLINAKRFSNPEIILTQPVTFNPVSNVVQARFLTLLFKSDITEH